MERTPARPEFEHSTLGEVYSAPWRQCGASSEVGGGCFALHIGRANARIGRDPIHLHACRACSPGDRQVPRAGWVGMCPAAEMNVRLTD